MPTGPYQASEDLQHYLTALIESWNRESSPLLQHHAVLPHTQSADANLWRAPRLDPPTFRAPALPPYPLINPSYLGHLPSHTSLGHGVISTESTIVSTGSAEPQALANSLEAPQLLGPHFNLQPQTSHDKRLPTTLAGSTSFSPLASDQSLSSQQPASLHSQPSSSEPGSRSSSGVQEQIVQHQDASASQDRPIPEVGAPSEAADDDLLRAQELQAEALRLRYHIGADLYRMVYQPDASIDSFITTLLSRTFEADGEGANHLDRPGRIDPIASDSKDPNAIAVHTFWHKNSVKVMLMPHPSGPKRLLVTFIRKPWYLVHQEAPGFIGVWQIMPPKPLSQQRVPPSLTDFFLHGFYPATGEEYRRLAEQPEHIDDFWVTIRRSRALRLTGLYINVARMTDVEMQKMDANMREGNYATLFQNFRVERPPPLRVETSHHFYEYRPDPDLYPLVAQWALQAKLTTRSFVPIEVTQEERNAFPKRIELIFRSRRDVKVVTLPDGQRLMLCFHQQLTWLKRTRAELVSIWKVGTTEVLGDGSKHRHLTAVGLFHITRTNFNRLTPNTIPGLKNSEFQANRLDLP
ncbi:hypothetical protein PHSY_004600 [Pseudozyma hubeiensis SY62]|uniref:Uncharacterized protein n=1 Tax=Pseudozyma hubeiensis (strain SY62) TaxID=1305764 RepID=R9P6M8_PSEHS|nr:hypothetical protein PHSY_004600 [Pseudozyma hubeiensis SY62]GAC97016.1 hypothetical protein PHSY_004600 [Pseudozyma hubeiensis SY62]